MKIIINESQLRLIIEHEDKDNLINFTHVYTSGIPPEEWDDMFEHINTKKKNGGKYDGYYIDGDVDLQDSNITELKYLVRVEGSLNLNGSKIKMLPIQFMVLEMFNNENRLAMDVVLKAPFFSNYSSKFINDIVGSLVSGGLLKVHNDSLNLITSGEIKNDQIESPKVRLF